MKLCKIVVNIGIVLVATHVLTLDETFDTFL